MNCPKCKSEIASDDINIQKDIAKCANCNHVFTVSSIVTLHRKVDVNNPPKGAWYLDEYRSTIVGASTRSPIAFFLVPFMLVWSGGSLGGIYGGQILSGEYSLMMSLFGLPFLIGTIILGSVTVMAITGKVELRFDKESGTIFTGVGNLGITKTFYWKDIDEIRETTSMIKSSNSNNQNISLIGQGKTSFGTGLNDERRYFILNVLQNYLADLRK